MGINNSMAICLYFKILALLKRPLFCFKWTVFKNNPSSIFFMIKKYLHSIGKGSESFFSINKGRGTYLTEKKIDY